MNKDQVEGKYDKAKGEVKQVVGDLTGNEKMKAEGTWDKVKGTVKEAIGNAKEEVKE